MTRENLKKYLIKAMYKDPDLSAVVTRVIAVNPSSNLLKRKMEFADDEFSLPKSRCSFQAESLNLENIVKKQKVYPSQLEAIDILRMIPNLCVKPLYETPKVEPPKKINDSFLITTFSKAIFRFTINELLLESASSPAFAKSVDFFRNFAAKYYDKISDFEAIKWIWTIDEKEGVWLTTCKKVYREFSQRFFGSEKIISRWIDSQEIRDVISLIYSKYKDVFAQCFSNPKVLAQLTPLVNIIHP